MRLVAATHRNLEEEASRGTFRRDLFYRLFVIPIRLPSLRERPEDIALLALHFLNRANQAHQRNVNFAPDALARLAQHDWPGNIRELGNVVERVVLLSDSAVVSAAALQRLLHGAGAHAAPQRQAAPAAALTGPSASAGSHATPGLPSAVRDYWRANSHPASLLADALARQGGNRSRAAQALGMTARQFSYRWKKLGLPDD